MEIIFLLDGLLQLEKLRPPVEHGVKEIRKLSVAISAVFPPYSSLDMVDQSALFLCCDIYQHSDWSMDKYSNHMKAVVSSVSGFPCFVGYCPKGYHIFYWVGNLFIVSTRICTELFIAVDTYKKWKFGHSWSSVGLTNSDWHNVIECYAIKILCTELIIIVPWTKLRVILSLLSS